MRARTMRAPLAKVLIIIYNCKRSDDAWRNNINRIKQVNDLYNMTIGTIFLKDHLGFIEDNCSNERNDVKLKTNRR